ncbi:hypothetical protein [Colwellia piezophila]|uniref:hypothetical protein n=1 Tax=Colwellia piezophila TaxID=211668 RepID=UPI000362F48F|nr:hypothetical protein [Colwellia piezophila]
MDITGKYKITTKDLIGLLSKTYLPKIKRLGNNSTLDKASEAASKAVITCLQNAFNDSTITTYISTDEDCNYLLCDTKLDDWQIFIGFDLSSKNNCIIDVVDVL